MVLRIDGIYKAPKRSKRMIKYKFNKLGQLMPPAKGPILYYYCTIDKSGRTIL